MLSLRSTPFEFSSCTAVSVASSRVYSPFAVIAILLLSVSYLAILSFFNAHGLRTSTALVGLAEALLFMACAVVVIRNIPPLVVLLILGICAWLLMASLFRQQIDAKGLRDLLIPILFICLGRQVADIGFADRAVKIVLTTVVSVGLFEAMFIDTYARLFNTFSFYVNLGSISEERAMFTGQMLTLNGFRPEGIGRTILPGLLGNHRASSLLMDPVSLGNFAVIVLAWGLTKSRAQWWQALPFVVGAMVLIALADSRFGLMLLAAMLLMRLCPARLVDRAALLLPLLVVVAVIVVPLLAPEVGDTFLGRVTKSGAALLRFDLPILLGMAELPNFGDMGYAYVFSRFGLPLCVLLVISVFLLPNHDPRGMRYRAFLMLYLSLILSVSGTSLFALKTAGILWFLLGVLTTLPSPVASQLTANGRSA